MMNHAAEAERFLAWADNPTLPPENVAAISSMAQVHATLALVDQQRTANRLQVTLIDQLGEIASMTSPPGYPHNPRLKIREYLTEDEWNELGL